MQEAGKHCCTRQHTPTSPTVSDTPATHLQLLPVQAVLLLLLPLLPLAAACARSVARLRLHCTR